MTETDEFDVGAISALRMPPRGILPLPSNKSPGLKNSKRNLSSTKDNAANPTGEAKKRSKQEIDDLSRRCAEALNHIRGEICLAEGKFSDALDHLKKVGNLPKEQLAYALSLAGDHDEAVKKAREEATDAAEAVLPRAVLVEVLRKKGDQDAARTEFETLRKLAATADLTIPALARLSSFSQELGYPEDWRKPLDLLKISACAPHWIHLAHSLGVRGQRSPGACRSYRQEVVAPSDFGNQPVVVFFYLGHGCIHCVEQLNTFVPWPKNTQLPGFNSSQLAPIRRTLCTNRWSKPSKMEAFRFPILANPELDHLRNIVVSMISPTLRCMEPI